MAKPDPCAKIVEAQKKGPSPTLAKALEGVPRWDKFDPLRAVDFSTMMMERQAVKEAEDAAVARRKALDDTIRAYLMVVEQKAVEWNGHKVQIVPGRAESKISKKLLVEKDVDPDIVQQCVVPGKSYEYVLVSKPGDKEADNADAE